jgi:uncharacterized protein YcaQ
MKPRPLVDAPPISAEQVAAFRLARHHLAAKANASQLARVAGDMAGVQAQVMSAAQMSLWTRTRGLRADDVERALWHDRTLAKVWCMRGSLHLIPSRDFAVFVRGCARREARSADWLARAGIPSGPVDKIVQAIADALDQPLTRGELVGRLSGSFKIRTKRKADRGWGGAGAVQGFEVGGTILSVHGMTYLACMRGLACFGPMRGNEATFVRPEKWLPNSSDQPQERAERELLRRYLRAHGPATVADFALWTYMKAADAREVWSHLADELAPVNVGDRLAWALQSDVSALQRATLETPSVRLLPFFDSLLLGLKDKSHLVDAAHYKRVYRPQGWLSPVVLVDGRVAGVWSYGRKGRRLGIRVEPFKPLPAVLRTAVRDETEDLRRFLDAPEVAVTFARA